MEQKMFLAKNDTTLSLEKRCELLSLNRSTTYYKYTELSKENTDLMNLIYEIWLEHPFYGYRKLTAILQNNGFIVNHKRILRLMQHMGIQSIHPKKKPKIVSENKIIYPYLLNDIIISKPNQVWGTDLTYLRMQQGFMYLIAIIDLFSRYIVSWKLLNTMEVIDCIGALHAALETNIPDIFNTDQGSQFTSADWINCLLNNNVKVSMNGKGRCFDNIYVERLWRTIKYEDFYLNCYNDGWSLENGLKNFIQFYNTKRPHQSLDYKTPAEIYFDNVGRL
jgi:putative transposase